MTSSLPHRPNLLAIKDAARHTQNRRTLILSLIGNLSFCWSNNESMFIYVIMMLLKTDEISAKVVFGTLNTTRARVDLIERLAVANLRDPKLAQELKRILRIFSDCTRVRNEFIHCMFKLNDEGDITHTHSLRLQIIKDELQSGVTREINDARIKKMVQTVKKLIRLNDDIWNILPQIEAHMAEQSKGREPGYSTTTSP